MGYRLKRLDEPIFMAGPKPMRIEFGIHQRLESCALKTFFSIVCKTVMKICALNAECYFYYVCSRKAAVLLTSDFSDEKFLTKIPFINRETKFKTLKLVLKMPKLPYHTHSFYWMESTTRINCLHLHFSFSTCKISTNHKGW